MVDFPTYDETPSYLRTGMDVSLLNAYNIAVRMTSPAPARAEPEPPPARPPRSHHANPAAPRVYASAYLGVSTRRGLAYLANWSVRGKGKTGPLRPPTPEGERQAAQDRARALGRDYLERRDGTREAL